MAGRCGSAAGPQIHPEGGTVAPGAGSDWPYPSFHGGESTEPAGPGGTYGEGGMTGCGRFGRVVAKSITAAAAAPTTIPSMMPLVKLLPNEDELEADPTTRA